MQPLNKNYFFVIKVTFILHGKLAKNINYNPYPEIATINILIYVLPASPICRYTHPGKNRIGIWAVLEHVDTLVPPQRNATESWWGCGGKSRMVFELLTRNEQPQVLSSLPVSWGCYHLITIPALPLMACFVVLNTSYNSSQPRFLIQENEVIK